jgi:hypothetical protein
VIYLILVLVAAVVTVMLGRRDPRILTRIGLGALTCGLVALGVVLASGNLLLLYLWAVAAAYGLAVLFGRLILALRARHHGVGAQLHD